MSINRERGGLLRKRRVKTPRGEFKHRRYLFARDMEPVHDLVDRGPRLQVLEHDGNRRPSIAKYPGTAALTGDTLHSRAL